MSLQTEGTTRPVARVRERVQELALGGATPQRLRRLGAALFLAALLAGLVGMVSGINRAEAVNDGSTRLAALTADAAAIYSALGDADAMATSGYVTGGTEPPDVRARYDADIQAASAGLVTAASLLSEDDPATVPLTTISAQLPTYTGLVDTARAYNRQNLPLGQAYLGAASRLMRNTILPAAAELRSVENVRLTSAFGNAGALPIATVAITLAALLAVVDAARRERQRTNRVVNVGLSWTGGALVLLLLWWLVASAVAGFALTGASRHATASTALDDARATILQARSNENLVLVARGSGGISNADFIRQTDELLAPGGDLASAEESGARLDPVRSAVGAWVAAHDDLRALDDSGNYAEAVASATGSSPSQAGGAFERVDDELGVVIVTEREAFAADARLARWALVGLPVVSALLGLLAAAGIVAGVGRRLGEYR